MKIVLFTLIAIITVLCILFVIWGQASKNGTAIGLVKGKLAICPDKPNCVCSEYDDEHLIEPLSYEYSRNTAAEIWALLQMAIVENNGHIINNQSLPDIESYYLAATFSSPVFGFVDDMEARLDVTHQQIHMRSASRQGYSDFGVNKKRMLLIKNSFDHKLDKR